MPKRFKQLLLLSILLTLTSCNTFPLPTPTLSAKPSPSTTYTSTPLPTDTPTPTQTPTITLTPKPTATSTPTASPTLNPANMTREQIDAWLNDAGVVINWGPEFVENHTKGVDYNFSSKLQQVIGGKVVIYDPYFQMLNGYWYARLAALDHYFFDISFPNQAELDRLIRSDSAGFDFSGYQQYGQSLIEADIRMPIRGVTITGIEFEAEIGHTVFVMLTKTEFQALLKTAQNQALPVAYDRLHRKDGEAPNVVDSMVLVIDAQEVYIFGYNLGTGSKTSNYGLASANLKDKQNSVAFIYKGMLNAALWSLVSGILYKTQDLEGYKITYSHPDMCFTVYSPETCAGFAEKTFLK
jgi:hypothetical protein